MVVSIARFEKKKRVPWTAASFGALFCPPIPLIGRATY